MKLLATLVLLFTSGSVALAQTLWQNTNCGMTKEEVSALYPNAKPLDDGDLELTDLMIAKTAFSIRFAFTKAKLTQVVLTPREKPSAVRGKLLFDELMNILRSKYGEELSIKINPSPYWVTAVWSVDKTTIQLELMSIDRDKRLLLLTYEARLANEASKL